MKTKKPKKHYPTDIPLAENVRLLKCGAWGYVYNGRAIFRSADVDKVNSFSNWAKETIESGIFDDSNKEILETADFFQKFEGEPKILPQCFDSPHWRVEGNNYEAKTKIPNHK